MSQTAKALVTPHILVWARERSGLSELQAADKAKVDVDKLLLWESGQDQPTFVQAKHLAKTYMVPFGYFYLERPPQNEVTIPDRRTTENASLGLSPDFRNLLQHITARQAWFRDYIIDMGHEPLPFVGAFSVKDSTADVAASISDWLNLSTLDPSSCRSPKAYLRTLTERLEHAGVLVMHSGILGKNTNRKLDVKDFRGFALSDPYAPLVFTNDQDSDVAQVFTLLHEVAHIWIGDSSLTDKGDFYLPIPGHNDPESFCNRVAIEVLVPAQAFLEQWDGPGRTLEAKLSRLRDHFKVSRIALIRRAYELGKVTYPEYQAFYKAEMARFQKNKENKEPQSTSAGGNYYATALSRHGKKFSRAVVYSVSSGSLLYRDAARLLDIKVSHLPAFAERLGVAFS